MTRVLVVLGIIAFFAALPYLTARWLTYAAGPRELITLSLLALIGLALGGILILAMAAGPADLPIGSIPDAVSRCVGAVARVGSHPLAHWPHILVSVLVVAAIARLVWATMQTVRATNAWRRDGSSGGHIPPAADNRWPDVRVVDARVPLACTTGLFRPRIVVSIGLLRLLDRDGLDLVVAHERAHVHGWHPLLLFVGRVVSRAFGFLPPVRRALENLLLGLEFAADASAARVVGDPLAVARVLATLADRTYRGGFDEAPIEGPLHAGGSDIAARVRRLIGGRPTSHRKRWVATAIVLLAFLVPGAGIAAWGATMTSLAGSRRVNGLHAACHLPHGESNPVAVGP